MCFVCVGFFFVVLFYDGQFLLVDWQVQFFVFQLMNFVVEVVGGFEFKIVCGFVYLFFEIFDVCVQVMVDYVWVVFVDWDCYLILVGDVCDDVVDVVVDCCWGDVVFGIVCDLFFVMMCGFVYCVFY